MTLRFALRSLARTPGFTAVVVLCLALGIGVNVAFLRVIDVLMFRPPAGIAVPATLYRLEPMPADTAGQKVFIGLNLSRGDVERLAARRETFARVAAWIHGHDLSIGAGRDARQLDVGFVDGAYFGIVGARPLLGRLIGAGDGAGARTLVLGERLWRSAYGADPAIVGRRLRVSGEEAEVVGVVAAHTGTESEAVEAWMPVSAVTLTGWPKAMVEDRESRMFNGLVRLARGVAPATAARVGTTVLQEAPEPAGRMLRGARVAQVTPVNRRFNGRFLGGSSPVPLWLLGATAVVLLVACANVANLLLARGERRRRELATRSALGASRGVLVRQLLVESLVLSLAGGVLGLLVAQIGTRLFALLPGMPPLDGAPDPRTLAATLAVCLVSTLLSGAIPAVQGTRPSPALAMRSGTRVTTGSRWRGVLMAGQLAAALALMATAGVFVRSLRSATAVDAGYDLRHVVAVSVNLEQAGMGTAEREAFARRAMERVTALPGVRGVTRVGVVPFGGMLFGPVATDGAELPSMGPPGMQTLNAVGADYFSVIGLPLRRGRAFTAAEAASGAAVTVVSEAFARAAWGSADPIGRCVRIDGDACSTVVGVAANAPVFSLLRDTAPIFLYRPRDVASRDPELNLLVRTAGEPAPVASQVRAALQAQDERLPFVGAYALLDGPGLRAQLTPFRLTALAFTTFGALALLVAAIGLYAVIAYAVAQRTGEIGVRIALGATARAIRRLVLGEGMRHAAVGTALGGAAAMAVTHALRARLYGIEPWDLPTFAVVCVALLVTALLASWLPARRAARIAPTEALRSE